MGIRNFFFRTAFLVVGIVIPVVLFMTGYVPTDEMLTQTALAVWGIRVHRALIPMILYLVMGLLFRQFYDLDGKKKEELVMKLKEAGLFRA